MKFSRKIDYAQAMLKAKIFKKRIPLFVTWEITERCNARCKYCNIWDHASLERDTSQVLAIIRELGQLGTRMIHFTGGEPLLREDIGAVLGYCQSKRIQTSMTTNGLLVRQRINEISSLDLLGISLDGPEEVHDRIRGAGSYRGAMDALGAARDKGIKLRLLVVLSQGNLGAVDFLLGKAEEFRAPIIFQPATKLLLGGKSENPLAPPIERYRQTIKKLILKKRQTKYIVNSVSGLRFLYAWPDMQRIRCLMNLISCRIQSDGHVYICYRNQSMSGKIEEGRSSIKDAFLQLSSLDCKSCCCASSVELNFLLSLRLDSILNSLNLI